MDNLFCSTYLSDIKLSENEVVNALKSIDSSKGPGPDNIPPLFLKNCAETICTPLLLLFNKSLANSVFPDKWKVSSVIPIFKSGKKYLVNNYRPICILSAIPKLFESLVFKYVANHMKNIIIEQQHGFFKGRNIETNLLTFYEHLQEGLESRLQTDVIYADFRKAFDKINHSVLMKRLAEVGISGSLLRWLVSYIQGRSQFVMVNNSVSDVFYNTSGVPQGSHLGPLLFIIYINNIGQCFHHSRFLLYADDLKVFKNVGSFQDCEMLQADLYRLSAYCIENFLFLNLEKCYKVTFGRKLNMIKFNYSVDGHCLSEVGRIRDLGVIFDSRLIFDCHIDVIVNESVKMLGYIIRNSKLFHNNKTLLSLYYSFVYSKLNFASSIWNPQYKYYIERLERVQNKFLRYLSFKNSIIIENHDYRNVRMRFDLLSLKSCRKKTDVLLLYKVLNNILNVPDILHMIPFRVKNIKMRSLDLFYVPYKRTNVAQNSPLCRILATGNEFNDIDIFNIKLNKLKRVLKLRLLD